MEIQHSWEMKKKIWHRARIAFIRIWVVERVFRRGVGGTYRIEIGGDNRVLVICKLPLGTINLSGVFSMFDKDVFCPFLNIGSA